MSWINLDYECEECQLKAFKCYSIYVRLKDGEYREILRPCSRFVNVTEYESEPTASNHRCTRNGYKPFLEVEKKMEISE